MPAATAHKKPAPMTPEERDIAKHRVRAMLHGIADDVDHLPDKSLRHLMPALVQAEKEVAASLKEWLATAEPLGELKGSDRFTAHHYRKLLLQLRTARKAGVKQLRKEPFWTKELEREMFAGLNSARVRGGELATRHIQEEVATLSATFRHSMGPIPLKQAAIIARGERTIVPRIRTSSKRYAGAVWRDMKAQLAVGVVRAETVDQLTNRLQRLGGPRGLVALRGVTGEPGAREEYIAEGLFRRYRHWAERVVRTETINSYNLAADEGIKEAKEIDDGIKRRWDASLDSRLCVTCQDLHGEVVEVDEPFFDGSMHPPSHPNCFPGGMLVTGQFEAGLVVRYEGPIVELETARGLILAVTPNHRIAVPAGFVAAGTLAEGSEVLCDSDEAWVLPPAEIDEGECPAFVEQIFAALGVDRPHRRSVSADEDLHGDGVWTDGDIHIVGSNGMAPGDQHVEWGVLLAQRLLDLGFPLTAIVESLRVRLRSLDLLGERHLATADGPPCGRALALDGGSIVSRPLQSFRIGSAANWNVHLAKPAGECLATDSTFIAELLHRYPGQVAVDQIVEVRNREFSGHVYDLQSPNGWIVAQGIITSNCRCAVTAWHDDWDEDLEEPTMAEVQGVERDAAERQMAERQMTPGARRESKRAANARWRAKKKAEAEERKRRAGLPEPTLPPKSKPPPIRPLAPPPGGETLEERRRRLKREVAARYRAKKKAAAAAKQVPTYRDVRGKDPGVKKHLRGPEMPQLKKVMGPDDEPITATSAERMESIRQVFRGGQERVDRVWPRDQRGVLIAVREDGDFDIVDGRHRMLVAREFPKIKIPITFTEGVPLPSAAERRLEVKKKQAIRRVEAKKKRAREVARKARLGIEKKAVKAAKKPRTPWNERTLAAGQPIDVYKRNDKATSETFLAEMKDPKSEVIVDAIWKPASGEMAGLRANVPKGSYWKREGAAWRVAKVLKVDDMVPPSFARKDLKIPGQKGRVAGSLQQLEKTMGEHKGKMEDVSKKDIERMRVFDYVTGNSDRHVHNVLYQKQSDGSTRLVMIDNGLCFPNGPPERMIQPGPLVDRADIAGKALEKSTRDMIAGIDPKEMARELLDSDIERKAVKETLMRLDALKKDPGRIAAAASYRESSDRWRRAALVRGRTLSKIRAEEDAEKLLNELETEK